MNKNMILLIFFQVQKSSSFYPTVVLVNLLKILIYDLSFLQKYSNGMRRIDVAPFVNYGTRHRPQLQILSA